MDSGTKVYEGYVGINPENAWINEGIVTGIVVDGQVMVRYGDLLVAKGDRWRATKAEAKADIVAAMVRHIGRLQAKVDEMRDEILHETLTQEAA